MKRLLTLPILLAPGDYIRVGVSAQHNELVASIKGCEPVLLPLTASFRYNVGVSNGTHTVFYWKPGMETSAKGPHESSERCRLRSDAAFHGSLFTVDRSNSKPRIYKVESIAFNEESFVEITASYAPVDGAGQNADLRLGSRDFVIEDNN